MAEHSEPISDADRDRFDALVEEALDAIPPQIRDLLEEVPLIVIDEPTDAILRDLGMDPSDDDVLLELCGLHTGVPNTEPGLDAPPSLPGVIHMFRRGVIAQAGGWGEARNDGFLDDDRPPDDRVYEEIMITLLHEIGHQFGLDEDDLARLGYE